MKYMLLLYHAEPSEPPPPDAWAPWLRFEEEASKRATKVDAAALQPVATTKTVAVREGEMVVTDGPFTEAREQLGGYYVFDCASEAEALELAAHVPWAVTGHIQVRPVMEPPGE